MYPYQQDALHPEGAGVYGGLVIGVVGPTGTEKNTNCNLAKFTEIKRNFYEKIPKSNMSQFKLGILRAQGGGAKLLDTANSNR